MAPAAGARRVTLGFQGGQVLALRVSEQQLDDLNKALGGVGWHEARERRRTGARGPRPGRLRQLGQQRAARRLRLDPVEPRRTPAAGCAHARARAGRRARGGAVLAPGGACWHLARDRCRGSGAGRRAQGRVAQGDGDGSCDVCAEHRDQAGRGSSPAAATRFAGADEHADFAELSERARLDGVRRRAPVFPAGVARRAVVRVGDWAGFLAPLPRRALPVRCAGRGWAGVARGDEFHLDTSAHMMDA